MVHIHIIPKRLNRRGKRAVKAFRAWVQIELKYGFDAVILNAIEYIDYVEPRWRFTYTARQAGHTYFMGRELHIGFTSEELTRWRKNYDHLHHTER